MLPKSNPAAVVRTLHGFTAFVSYSATTTSVSSAASNEVEHDACPDFLELLLTFFVVDGLGLIIEDNVFVGLYPCLVVLIRPRVVEYTCLESPRCRSGLALAPASQAIMYTPPQELPDKEMLEGPYFLPRAASQRRPCFLLPPARPRLSVSAPITCSRASLKARVLRSNISFFLAIAVQSESGIQCSCRDCEVRKRLRYLVPVLALVCCMLI